MTQTTLRSEVTGTVRRIVAEPGATLAEDDTIIFLESMKMEIPLVASAACRLVTLLVVEGALVS